MRRLATIAAAALTGVAAALAAAPSYPGGEEALQQYFTQQTVYPKNAAANGIEGVVTVSCTINTDGTVSNPKVTNFIDPELEAEAIRIVGAMTGWIPAEENGRPVAATTEVNVKFELPE